MNKIPERPYPESDSVVPEPSYKRLPSDRNGIVDNAVIVKVNQEVNHPDHYTHGGIETIDYLRAKLSHEEFRGACKANVIKYLSRAGLKSPDARGDTLKAQQYMNWLAETYS